MKRIARYFAAAASVAAIALAGGCGEKGFKIEGQLADSDGDKVLLEKADFSGYWTIVDSTRTDSKGQFSFSQPQQSGPEIFRLSLDDKYIYLPVDSTETLTVSSSKQNFGHEFTVSGTEQATRMAQFDVQNRRRFLYPCKYVGRRIPFVDTGSCRFPSVQPHSYTLS